MQCSLQQVFQAEFAQYASGRRLHPRQWQAASAILRCYRPEAGFHYERCAAGHCGEPVFHACRHRSCPRCADKPRQQWVQAELGRLLPCAHFHVVFTLSHELVPLWEFNRKAMAKLLFDAVRLSLLELLHDPRHLGATPGLLMSMHTWGRDLSHHPHVHALVSAGGLDARGQWRACSPDFLVPAEPLRRLYRGKVLDALKQALRANALKLPPGLGNAHWLALIGRLYRSKWNVNISAPYGHGRGVALYLARYAKGGPLPKSRALLLHDHQVDFGYTDHRDHRRKTKHLAAHEFIDRILWHAPPKGSHMVRHAGLYASAANASYVRARLALAVGLQYRPATTLAATPHVNAHCQHCSLPTSRIYVRAQYRVATNQISPSVSPRSALHTPTSARAMHNQSFKLTGSGRTAWLRGGPVQSPPRSQPARPPPAA